MTTAEARTAKAAAPDGQACRLVELTIGNMARIEYLALRLDPQATVVHGRTATGKSTVLRAGAVPMDRARGQRRAVHVPSERQVREGAEAEHPGALGGRIGLVDDRRRPGGTAAGTQRG